MAQTNPSIEYRVKAIFLFNFTRFIDWPDSSFGTKDAPLVIGIIGEDPFGAYLDETVAGEKCGTHSILIQHYTEVTEINSCHILYINLSDPAQIKTILNTLAGRSILTVNDNPDFPRWGGMVRFFTENNKLRLQINAATTKAAQLNISSKLLGVAQIF
ncbi:MAG: YfiR family protein [Bacteroidia bacterium]